MATGKRKEREGHLVLNIHLNLHLCLSFKYLKESRLIKEKCKKADKFYYQNHVTVLFHSWRAYTHQMRVIKIKANVKYEFKMREMKIEAFREWREFVKTSKYVKLNENIADAFYLKNFLSKVS